MTDPINRPITSLGITITGDFGSYDLTTTFLPELIDLQGEPVSGSGTVICENGYDVAIYTDDIPLNTDDTLIIYSFEWSDPYFFDDSFATGTGSFDYDRRVNKIIRTFDEPVTSLFFDPIESYEEADHVLLYDLVASGIGDVPATGLGILEYMPDGIAWGMGKCFVDTLAFAIPVGIARGIGAPLADELALKGTYIEAIAAAFGLSESDLEFNNKYIEGIALGIGAPISICSPNHLDLEDTISSGIGFLESTAERGKSLEGIASNSLKLPIESFNQPITSNTWDVIYSGHGATVFASLIVGFAGVLNVNVKGLGGTSTTLEFDNPAGELRGFGYVDSSVSPYISYNGVASGKGRSIGSFEKNKYLIGRATGVGTIIPADLDESMYAEPSGIGDTYVDLWYNKIEFESFPSGTGTTSPDLWTNKIDCSPAEADGEGSTDIDLWTNHKEIEASPSGVGYGSGDWETNSYFTGTASGVGRSVGSFERNAQLVVLASGIGSIIGDSVDKDLFLGRASGVGYCNSSLQDTVRLYSSPEGVGSASSDFMAEPFAAEPMSGLGDAEASELSYAEEIDAEDISGTGTNVSGLKVDISLESVVGGSGDSKISVGIGNEVEGIVSGKGRINSFLGPGSLLSGKLGGSGLVAGTLDRFGALLYAEVTGHGASTGQIRDSSLGVVDNPKIIKYNEKY